MKEPIGRLGSLIPLRLRMMASLTNLKASFWPFTLLPKFSSKCKSFSFSLLTNLAIGILVHLLITFAISSEVTTSLKIRDFSCEFNSSNSFSNLGIVPWRRRAAVSKS